MERTPKSCGFDKLNPCDERCDYFHTCTRNPHRTIEGLTKFELAQKRIRQLEEENQRLRGQLAKLERRKAKEGKSWGS